MKRSVSFFALTLVLFWTTFANFKAHADALEVSSGEKMKARYKDYLEWVRDYEKHLSQLQVGADEVRDGRIRQEVAREKARREQVQNRRPPPDTSKSEAEYLRLQKKREAELEKIRLQYVLHREQLKRKFESVPRVPENFEAGLTRDPSQKSL